MIVLPIIPCSRLSFHSGVHLLLLTISVLLISLSLCGLALGPLFGILYLKLCYFLESHCRLIGIFLPNLCNDILPRLLWAHAVLDFFLWRDLPDFHLRERLCDLTLVLLLCFRVFLNGVFILEDFNLFFYRSQHRYRLMDLQHHKIFEGLPPLALLPNL